MKRVLVVDDSEEFREVLVDLLKEEGFAVEQAGSAEAALSLGEESSFDLIFCDLVMPLSESVDQEDSDSAMVGVHAIGEFSKRFPQTPVVAISGHLTGEPLKAMQTFGAQAVLSKPFGHEELVGVLKKVLP